MKLLFTHSSNKHSLKKINPTPFLKEPVLVSDTIIANSLPFFLINKSTITSQLNVKNNQENFKEDVYYSKLTTNLNDLNDLKYKNQLLNNSLKNSMIGRITTNISNCKSCGK